MPDVSINITNSTPSEQRTGAFILGKYNLKQTEQQLPPYANVAEIVEVEVKPRLFPKWERMEADERAESDDLLTKFREADEATRDQITALLNP